MRGKMIIGWICKAVGYIPCNVTLYITFTLYNITIYETFKSCLFVSF